MKFEVLRELWRITKYASDGSVMGTEFVKEVWVDSDARPPENHQYVYMSSDYTGRTIRRRGEG